eukprot:6182716-Pleurochrysis_carterae.AAC.2
MRYVRLQTQQLPAQTHLSADESRAKCEQRARPRRQTSPVASSSWSSNCSHPNSPTPWRETGRMATGNHKSAALFSQERLSSDKEQKNGREQHTYVHITSLMLDFRQRLMLSVYGSQLGSESKL